MDSSANPTGLEIAVIGMAGRFPGAGNIDEFWENLKIGVESISFYSHEELLEAGTDAQMLTNPNYVKAHAMLEDGDCFDASFFGYTPREAQIMDPQLRVFHECVWHALEDAGYDPGSYNGSIGLYGGASPGFFWRAGVLLSGRAEGFDALTLSHLVEKDYLAVRVTYKLGLKGPAVSMYTACSTSLVSIHLACQALLSGECGMALAGGVTVSQLEKGGYMYQEGMISAPDGHCRAFDAQSGGTIGGDGAGVVALKRLEEAVAHRDHIYAVIKGSAINNDGVRKVGFTAPSVEGQAEVIRIAQLMAEVEPESISYVETHGTATELGDTVEVEALKVAFNSDKRHFCGIGSVKSNMGHLDSAAGVTGFIKTVLSLHHKKIPPHLHFQNPNPKIDFENSPFYVNARLQDWKNEKYPLRAGVSSFGIGGTNAHIVLEEWIPVPPVTVGARSPRPQLILLSAKTPSALSRTSENLSNFLKNPVHPTNPFNHVLNIAYTLQVGRRHFDYREMTVCSSVEEAAEALSTPDSPKRFSRRINEENPPVVFMFSGQGSQYVNMGRGLYDEEPVFRREMDRCFDILHTIAGKDIKAFLYPRKKQTTEHTEHTEEKEMINHVLYSGPVKFALEYSMARLLMAWGVRPYAMMGHSFGEYMAACAAGVFSLEDALELVVLRGRVMEKTAPGAMMSVALPEKELLPLLGDQLSLAAVNTESLCIVSGPTSAMEDFEAAMTVKNVETIRLNVPLAGHSHLMKPILAEFKEGFRSVKLNEPGIPYISGLTGQWITPRQAADPGYWCRHMAEPVRFADGLTVLLKESEPLFVQMGSDRGLPLFVSQHPDIKPHNPCLNLVRHPKEPQPDMYYLLDKIGQLWLSGVSVDWDGFYGDDKPYRVPLPGYPFDKQKFPMPGDPFKQAAEMLAGNALNVKKPDMADWFYIPTWSRTRLPGAAVPEERSPEEWLVFADDGTLSGKLRRRLEDNGHRLITVIAGKDIDPTGPEDYLKLVDRLLEQGTVPRRILHLWNLSPAARARATVETVDPILDLGFYSLFHLARALADRSVTTSLRIETVTAGMQSVTGDEPLQPQQAAMLGPVKVIPLEFSNITCRSIDVLPPETGSIKEDRLVDLLINELRAEPPEPVIAYRGSVRWEFGVKPVRMEESTSTSLPFKENGVYMITGGLGGIGLVLAQHLAKSVKAKLVLTGRSASPGTEVREMETLGAEVQIIRADVSDPEQMKNVIDRSIERFGTINGVIHCAGVPDGAAIQRRTIEMTRGILAPKIKGTLVLDHLLRDMDLDFIVLCSSINAMVPAFGQLAHCAANAFMDIFSHHKWADGGSPVISINWNSWLEVGQAAESARASGHANVLLSAEGTGILERVLCDPLPQVAVSTVDFAALLDRFNRFKPGEESTETVEEPAGHEPVKHRRPELKTEYRAPRDKLEEALVDIWRQNFGFDKIGIDDDFFQLGGDSLKGMMFVNQYKKLLGEIVHVTVVFNAPTIAELAAYFTRHYPLAVGGKNDTLGKEPCVDAAQVERVRQLIAYPAAAVPLPDMGKKNPPAVFILSPARSGSTLLRVMLAGHPDLLAPPELALLSFNKLGEMGEKPQGPLRAIMQLKECTLEAAQELFLQLKEQDITVKEFYRLMQQWAGDRLLVDKTPGYAMDINVLIRAEHYFENPLYIHLLRHPYGMIRSFEEARLDLFFGSRLLEELTLSRRQLAELNWTISNENILEFFEQVPGHRQHRVVFEELVKDPEPAMKAMCRFLGVPFHPAVLNPYEDKKKRMTDGIHDGGLMIGDVKFHQHKRIDPAVADTWKENYKKNFLGDVSARLAGSFNYRLLEETGYAAVPPAEKQDYYPLSPSQKQLYVLQQLDPEGTAYNMTRLFALTGAAVDRERLEDTFRRLIHRHDSLRTSFITVDDEPVQEIHDNVEFGIEIIETESTAVRPFDLSEAPLMRVGLIEKGEKDYVLAVDIHHIVSDATSHAVIAQDFMRLYAGEELPPLRLQYRDYVVWRQSPAQQAAVKKQETWWLETFSGEVPVLNLPVDFPRPAARSFAGAVKDFEVGKETAAALRELAITEAVTLNMLMLAIFHILLARLSGQDDIITGTSIKGRGHGDLEEIIGVFINTLALRHRPSADKTFRQFLTEVKERSTRAYENQDYPFDELVKKVWTHRDAARNPLFDVMFEMRSGGPESGNEQNTAGDGLKVEPLRHHSHITKFDQDWMGFESPDGIFFNVTYCKQLFKPETITFMIDCYRVLLEEVVKNCANPQLKIKDLRYSTAEDTLNEESEAEFDF